MNRFLPLSASPRLRVAPSRLLALSCLTILLLSSQTFAQAAPQPDLPAMIKSQDPAQQKQALTLIRAQIDRDGRKLDAGQFRNWIATLREAKLNAEAIEIIDRGLPLFQGRDSWLVVGMMGHKAEFSLAQGRKEDALAFLQQAPKLDSNGTISALDELRLAEPFVKAGLLEQTIDMIDQATLARADDLGCLERALAVRAQTFLAAGQPLPALASAKSLYNVSSMANTGKALGLLAKCLQAAYPEDRDLLIRFRDQQVAGAAPATTQPAAAQPTVLGQVKVSAAVYEKPFGNSLLPTLAEEDFAKLTRAGNLLLLADRPLDAKLWFEQAYRVCNTGQLPQATESLARALKAQDGTIGRANAFLLALRPTKPAPQ